jgi:hypothetical protein
MPFLFTNNEIQLFYGKRSQFVHGKEAEVANVSVGRTVSIPSLPIGSTYFANFSLQAIQERIKQLEFQDCKVRVSNVDAQATFDNIVIQVIGETSNKAGEPRKFVQTFVLAQQPSGYFVLNDIFRFIDEDDEEEATAEPAAPETAEPASEPVTVAPAVEPVAVPVPEETPKTEEEAVINGTDAEAVTGGKTETNDEIVKQVETEVAEEDVEQPDKPASPAQTPIPAAKVESAPAEPAAPPKPMTWASRAAAAAGPRPVVPLPKTATPPAANPSRAPAPAAQAAAPAAPAVQASAAAATAASNADAPAKEASGWQTAGADFKRQKPQAPSSAEKEGTMGYVKYVTEKVQEPELRAALAAHGELSYFDINRQKVSFSRKPEMEQS